MRAGNPRPQCQTAESTSVDHLDRMVDSGDTAGRPVPGQDQNLYDRRLLDVRDLASIFKCHRETIKRLARSGELPAFKLLKHWYVRPEDLELYLADKVESTRHLRRLQEE